MPPSKPDALGALLAEGELSPVPGTATVLVAPRYEEASKVAGDLSRGHAGPGGRTHVLALAPDGTAALDGKDIGRPDEEAWGALSESLQGHVVVVHGPLAEAASAALQFAPALAVTDGGSVEEARLRLSASARKARLLTDLHGGDFDTLFGTRDASEHGVLSDLVGRIVGLERVGGDLVPARVCLYPDGLDNLADVIDLLPGGGVYGTGGAQEGSFETGDLPRRLADLARVAYVPVLSPFPAAGTEPGSRSFGHAFLPEGTRWPALEGGAYDLVLQLDLPSLPEPAQALLGSRGTFQLFLDLTDVDTPCLGRTVDASGPGGYAPPPRPVGRGSVPRTILGWREVRDNGDATEFHAGRLSDFADGRRPWMDAVGALGPDSRGSPRISEDGIDHAVREFGMRRDEGAAIADALAHHDTDKLLGWPSWTQSADWPVAPDGRRMVLLFQFQMTEGDVEGGHLAPGLFAPDGTAHVFVTEEGPPEFAFGWACG